MAGFFIARQWALQPLCLDPTLTRPAPAVDPEAGVAGMATSWDWRLRRLSGLLGRWIRASAWPSRCFHKQNNWEHQVVGATALDPVGSPARIMTTEENDARRLVGRRIWQHAAQRVRAQHTRCRRRGRIVSVDDRHFTHLVFPRLMCPLCHSQWSTAQAWHH